MLAHHNQRAMILSYEQVLRNVKLGMQNLDLQVQGEKTSEMPHAAHL